MAAASLPNVRVESLVFPDDSQYRGQVSPSSDASPARPHGYGTLQTKEGFRLNGYFIEGRTAGAGEFVAPSGDTFWGRWNLDHKKEGEGAFFAAKAGKLLVERWEAGKLVKRVNARPTPDDVVHWKVPQTVPEGGERPRGRVGHSATRCGHEVVVFGGERVDADGKAACVDELLVLDTRTMEWSRPECGGRAPPAMHGHTATLGARGDTVYFVGGQTGMEVHSAVYALHVPSRSWSCVLQRGINFAGHTASLVAGRIVVVVQGSVYSLDPAAAAPAWEEHQCDASALHRARVPLSMVGHSAVVRGSVVYVFGGRVVGGGRAGGGGGGGKEYQRCSSAVAALDTSTMRWSPVEAAAPEAAPDAARVRRDYSGIPVPSHALPRADHTATLVDGRYMYVFGGLTTSAPQLNVVDTSYLNDVQVLDLDELQWVVPPVRFTYTMPRGQHTATLAGDGRLLVVGGCNHAYEQMHELAVLRTADPRKKRPRPRAKKPVAAAPAAAAKEEAKPPGPSPPRKRWARPASAAAVPGPAAAAGGGESIMAMFQRQHEEQQQRQQQQ